MKKGVIFFALGLALFLLGSSASSQADSLGSGSFTYPVAELGNCQDEAVCKSYCDKPQNMKPCLDFAEKNGLLTAEETARARAFADVGKGPGGCTSPAVCETYCDDANHISECIAFAEEHNLIPPEELAEAKKVQAALAQGAKMPGGCTRKQECQAYCEDSDHPERMEECITFAESAGFIPPEELAEAKKVLEAVRKGAKPPPCRGKAECDKYCSEPQNFEQCITFAEAAGFVTAEEAAMARKTGGKGPGGCKGKEECDAFCQNPANQETCFNFAKEHGLISEEDLQKMEEGRQQMMEGLNQAPPQVMECLKSTVGEELIEKLKAGTAMPSQDLGDKMRSCFEQFMPGPPEGMPPPGMVGPEGTMVPEGMMGPPSPEVMQQMQQQMQQQYGQPPPPPPGGGAYAPTLKELFQAFVLKPLQNLLNLR